MQDASETHGVAGVSHKLTHVARAIGGRALAVALTVALLGSGCGLKGSLTLPEKPRNVVIRPGPGGEAAPAPAPTPEAEPLPPPELPPDTRGNTRD
jgi:predicted small lipoprotein YifL